MSWTHKKAENIQILSERSSHEAIEAGGVFIAVGMRSEEEGRHRTLMQVVAAAEVGFWTRMRSIAGVPGGLNNRPMTRPENWHWHAIDEEVRDFLEMVKLADLDLFNEETVIGHAHYTLSSRSRG